MMNKQYKNSKKRNIYDKYREALGMPDLTVKEIAEMRYHLRLLAQTICEHGWKKKVY